LVGDGESLFTKVFDLICIHNSKYLINTAKNTRYKPPIIINIFQM